MKGLRAFLLSITFDAQTAGHVTQYFCDFCDDVYECIMRATRNQLDYVRRYLYRDKPHWEYELDRLLFEHDLHIARRDRDFVYKWAQHHKFNELAAAIRPRVYWHDRQQGAYFEGVIESDNGRDFTLAFSNGHRERATEKNIRRSLADQKDVYAVGDRVLVRRQLAEDSGVVSWWKGRVVEMLGTELCRVKWTCALDDDEDEIVWVRKAFLRPQ